MIAVGPLLYVTPRWFEDDSGRNHRTVRSWIRSGQARSVTRDGTLYVHWGDVRKLHRELATQERHKRSA